MYFIKGLTAHTFNTDKPVKFHKINRKLLSFITKNYTKPFIYL